MLSSVKRALLVAAAAAMTASTLAPTAAVGRGQSSLAEVRKATARFHDVQEAIAAGYGPTTECVPGMGYHFVNFRQFGGMDPLKPDALIYAANKHGRLRLVAVEWFKVDGDQNLATDGDRPSMFGKQFDGPMPGHGPGMPIHYDLHAYLWQGNPDGVLATWNRNIDCPAE